MNIVNQPVSRSFLLLLIINIALVIGLSWWLLHCLKKAEGDYSVLAAISQELDILEKTQNLVAISKDTVPKGQMDSLITTVNNGVENLQTLAQQQEDHESVTFFDILLMMMLAGSLGGVLCNLRGFFIHFRSEEASFPDNLHIPYYTRAFLGGGAGLFIYFVASFLITSVTTEQTATNVSFPGMVTFIALAMFAGFGSMEFFQRLKETCMALFGQKAEQDKWQKLEDLYARWKKGLLTDEEYLTEKAQLLASSAYSTKSFTGQPKATQGNTTGD